MKYLFVCWFLVSAWNVKATHAVCWDTGCQLDSWAVRGCQQYGMVETGQKSCPNGIIYSCCELNQNSAPSSLTSRPKCWDTGCQLDSWAVRGCQQYGMVETGQKSCPNGIIYSCCEQNQNSAPSSLTSRPKCWDTGCQLDSWAVRGCQQYGMVETGQKSCPNGIIYSCCEQNQNSAPSSLTSRPKCWDTGCQLDSWAVRGCQQYGMIETGQKSCPNGIIYSCCEQNQNSAPPSLASRPKCWDTGCQLDVWAIRGCQQYGMVETGQKTCQGGIIYSCCETSISNNISTSGNYDVSSQISNANSTTNIAKPPCWDTGCQLDSWKVRGCEQYDMAEVGQKWCDGGIVYSCCNKSVTGSVASVQSPKPKCWDTGCQLDSWAIRGCKQYEMIETGQKPCPNGIIYSCCETNATSSTNTSSHTSTDNMSTKISSNSNGNINTNDISSEFSNNNSIVFPTKNNKNNTRSIQIQRKKPKCRDTECQSNSSAVRGCEQYHMVEVGQKPCHQGIVYSCCEKNDTTPKNGSSPTDTSTLATRVTVDTVVTSSTPVSEPLCLDTDCQLDSEKVRGCEQYNMTETGQRPCQNGTIYSCCRENGTPVASANNEVSLYEPTCWVTSCHLDSGAQRGCEQYDMQEVDQKSCSNGTMYSCCEKNVTLTKPLMLDSECWETGCQVESWAFRGCEQYDREVVSERPCDNGTVYTCCHKNRTSTVVPQSKGKCRYTGCQQDVWKSRGCKQYGMIEISQKRCQNGIIFTCCEPDYDE